MIIRPGPERLCAEAPAPADCSLVVLGASGNLSQTMLLPAVSALRRRGLLPPGFRLVGVDRRAPPKGYPIGLVGALDDPELARRLRELPSPVLYAALPPSAVPAAAALAARCGGWRLVVEKPFGYDLASARSLSDLLHERLEEHQVLRIDHYLGKDAVLNILTTRFENPPFEAAWDARWIESVRIELAETEGVEGRERFYDRVGVVRDVVQNHMLQLLALVAMERPGSGGDALRDAKVEALRAVGPAASGVLGQYEGYPVPGSSTPTYAELTLEVDSPRWKGVPFRLRAGKALDRSYAGVELRFKGGKTLAFELKPSAGLSFGLTVKSPGPRYCVADAEVDLRYRDAPDAYERLLLDALRGDRGSFIRQDAIEEAWRIVEPLLEPRKPQRYRAGSSGPPTG